jgi:hypothetical protein
MGESTDVSKEQFAAQSDQPRWAPRPATFSLSFWCALDRGWVHRNRVRDGRITADLVADWGAAVGPGAVLFAVFSSALVGIGFG